MQIHLHELRDAQALGRRSIVARFRGAMIETSSEPGGVVYLHLDSAASRRALREALDAADASARAALRETEGVE